MSENKKSFYNSDEVKNGWTLKDWTVHPALNLVKNHASEFIMKPRLMKLFEFFLQHNNQVVTKETIIDYVWRDRIVTENLLIKSISELRKLLEEHFGDSLQIETIRNVGYRLRSDWEIGVQGHEDSNQNIKRNGAALKYVAGLFILLFLVLLTKVLFVRPLKEYNVELHRISSNKGLELTPAISKNGKYLAFSMHSEIDQSFNIYVQPLSESYPRKLSDNQASDFNPVWSSDSDHIVFFRSDGIGGIKLMQKSVLGTNEIELVDLDNLKVGRDLIWTTDGRQLLFSARRNLEDPFAIYTYYFLTNEVEQLTYPDMGIHGDDQICHSIHNNRVVYARMSRAQSLISQDKQSINILFELDLNKKESRELTRIEKELKDIKYHPGIKSYLAWTSTALGNNELWQIDRKTEHTLIYILSSGMPGKGTVGSDGRFYFEYWNSGLDVAQIELIAPGLTAKKELLPWNSTQWEWGLSESIHSGRIAFVSHRTGHPEIWSSNSFEEEEVMQLSDFRGPNFNDISISPDGTKILCIVRENNNSNLYALNINGQQGTKITSDSYDYGNIHWSPDGIHYYYSSTESGEWNIGQGNTKTTKKKQITTNGGHSIRIEASKPDRLYFTKYQQDSIWYIDAKTNNPIFLYEASGLETNNWVIAASGIYYLAYDSAIWYLRYYDFKSQKITNVRILKSILPGLPALSISPDGRRLYIAQPSEVESDILALSLSAAKD